MAYSKPPHPTVKLASNLRIKAPNFCKYHFNEVFSWNQIDTVNDLFYTDTTMNRQELNKVAKFMEEQQQNLIKVNPNLWKHSYTYEVGDTSIVFTLSLSEKEGIDSDGTEAICYIKEKSDYEKAKDGTITKRFKKGYKGNSRDDGKGPAKNDAKTNFIRLSGDEVRALYSFIDLSLEEFLTMETVGERVLRLEESNDGMVKLTFPTTKFGTRRIDLRYWKRIDEHFRPTTSGFSWYGYSGIQMLNQIRDELLEKIDAIEEYGKMCILLRDHLTDRIIDYNLQINKEEAFQFGRKASLREIRVSVVHFIIEGFKKKYLTREYFLKLAMENDLAIRIVGEDEDIMTGLTERLSECVTERVFHKVRDMTDRNRDNFVLPSGGNERPRKPIKKERRDEIDDDVEEERSLLEGEGEEHNSIGDEVEIAGGPEVSVYYYDSAPDEGIEKDDEELDRETPPLLEIAEGGDNTPPLDSWDSTPPLSSSEIEEGFKE